MQIPGPVLIEQSHRLGKVKEASGAGTQRAVWHRVITMKPFNYTDKIRMMTATRLKGPILLDNQTVMFFPEVSAELVTDFGRDRPRPRPALLGAEEVEVMETCKYLVLWLDNKLDIYRCSY